MVILLWFNDFAFCCRKVRKLVRDKIPEIILTSGKVPVTQMLTGEQLTTELYEKLVEEHAELLESKNLEEIVDMIEVLFAIAKNSGFTEQQILESVYQKRTEKGTFEKGFFLISIA